MQLLFAHRLDHGFRRAPELALLLLATLGGERRSSRHLLGFWLGGLDPRSPESARTTPSLERFSSILSRHTAKCSSDQEFSSHRAPARLRPCSVRHFSRRPSEKNVVFSPGRST